MQVVLIMFRNGGERRSFTVSRSTTTIGRREDCDLRIPVGDVSRKHCRLVLTGDNVRIQDLGSSNGTFVNGQQTQDAFLNPGDTIGVGPVHFVVQIDGVPTEDEMTPPMAAAADPDDSALGFTAASAAAAAAAAGSLAGESSDVLDPAVVEDDGLLDEVATTDNPGEGLAEDDVSTEDVAYAAAGPGESVGSVQDLAFDLTTDTDPEAATPSADDAAVMADLPDAPAAAPAGEEDWDFLLEEPEAGKADAELDVNLDSSQPPPHG